MIPLRTAVIAMIPPPLKRRIHRLRVARSVIAYTPRTVTHTFGGTDLTVSLQDPLGEGWYDHDWGPQAEIDRLRQSRLRPGARIFDVGAHQGVVALMLSRIVGDDGEVIAVEAERHNVEVAHTNMRLNGAVNVRVVHAAGADKVGRLFFSESLNGSVTPGGRSGKVEVDAVTIDGLAERFGRPDVVFVDVEGYEAHVLLGAQATLAARHADFFVEVHDASALDSVGASADDVIQSLVANGYQCCAVGATPDGAQGAWRPVSDASSFRGARAFVVATAAT